jgi:hypothetical protein
VTNQPTHEAAENQAGPKEKYGRIKRAFKFLFTFIVYAVFLAGDIEYFDKFSHILSCSVGVIATVALIYIDGYYEEIISMGTLIALSVVSAVIWGYLYFTYPIFEIDQHRDNVIIPVNPPSLQARHLSAHERQVLIAHLSQFKGTKIAAGAPFGDDEAKAFRDDLVDALTSAVWAFDGHLGEAEMQPPAFGVGVRVNRGEIEAGRIPVAAAVLVATLVDLHIVNRSSEGRLPIDADPAVHADRFWLFVGPPTAK